MDPPRNGVHVLRLVGSLLPSLSPLPNSLPRVLSAISSLERNPRIPSRFPCTLQIYGSTFGVELRLHSSLFGCGRGQLLGLSDQSFVSLSRLCFPQPWLSTRWRLFEHVGVVAASCPRRRVRPRARSGRRCLVHTIQGDDDDSLRWQLSCSRASAGDDSASAGSERARCASPAGV